MPTIQSSSGRRKYTEILEKMFVKNVKGEHRCDVKCTRIDTMTIVNGVKKEKVRLKKKQRIPKGLEKKLLDVELTDEGITFKLVEDTSVNNL